MITTSPTASTGVMLPERPPDTSRVIPRYAPMVKMSPCAKLISFNTPYTIV